jgi:uncharacterized membrane protein HdeD (DUF308 family)
MQCPTCRKTIPDASPYCAYCGAATRPAALAGRDWPLLIKGGLAFIVGAILLWSPAKTKVNTYMLLISILGIWWLVSGIIDIVSIFTDRKALGRRLFMGIVSIIVGGYILMYPIATGLVLPMIFVLVLGVWAFIEGLVLLFMTFKGARILGVLTIILGIILLGTYAMPGVGLTFIWVGAICGVIGGIIMVIRALR